MPPDTIKEEKTFIKSMKLNDEKKFFVNKNLFETSKTFLNPLTSNNAEEKKVNEKNENAEEVKKSNLVEEIKLSSTDALKQAKLNGKESPVVRSLFDFQAN